MVGDTISLIPVKDILGMNFFIPDYQRGYRWEKQQAIDLLEDILYFANHSLGSEEIYCIQPLVVSEKEDDILAKCKDPSATLEDIKKYIKGSWNVVDGQQRISTIFLLLSCLGVTDKYEIDYCTRQGSKEFLSNIFSKTEADAKINIDYYHMYLVFSTIREWLNNRNEEEKEKIKEALLNQVNFIWYQVKSDEIAVFTRLNIGKIPLTDSELIKALFLNRSNFNFSNKVQDRELETTQRRIAMEWDLIEHTMQNDEFWAFIHDAKDKKPTRIDFVLDTICKEDNFKLKLYIEGKRPRKEKKEQVETHNKDLLEKIGNDEHKTFRYFNEAFNTKRKNGGKNWLNDLWAEVKYYYQVFNEWYQDYRFYHYIGYLSSISSSGFDIADYVTAWKGRTKKEFIEYLKEKIVEQFRKKPWIQELKTYKFDQDGNKNKRECVSVLLLHNVETIIQQNKKLVSETKYNLPNFSKFPFHLYKRENWQVEHIRPNAGDDLTTDSDKKLYLLLAKRYFQGDSDLCKKIDDYIQNDTTKTDFKDILAEILQKGGSLSDQDKNRIWNYALLDASTNQEYGNQIFPVKRAFIANKINGKKVKYSIENEKLIEKDPVPEVAFVPPCTQNVFSKLYTNMPTTMINWNKEDAEAYWKDISEKLKYYFSILGIN